MFILGDLPFYVAPFLSWEEQNKLIEAYVKLSVLMYRSNSSFNCQPNLFKQVTGQLGFYMVSHSVDMQFQPVHVH